MRDEIRDKDQTQQTPGRDEERESVPKGGGGVSGKAGDDLFDQPSEDTDEEEKQEAPALDQPTPK